MAVLGVSIAPNLPGFINAATQKSIFPAFFDSIYSYAWFVGVTIAVILYWLLMNNQTQDRIQK